MGGVQWTGRWIWAPERPAAVLLRRYIDLSGVPASAVARVTADSRYVLWVNGVEVGRGPARSNPDRLAYDTVELAPHLRRGGNTIAALAHFYGGGNRWWRPAAPAGDLGHGSFLFDAPEIGMASDASWRAQAFAGASEPESEMVIALADIDHWSNRGDADDVGTNAVELGEAHDPPFTAMEPSAMAPLTVRPRPGTLVATSEGFATFDIGRETHGTVTVTVRAPAGTRVELAVGEDIGENGRAITEPRRWTARITTGGTGDERFETFDPIGFRYLTVSTTGEVLAAGAVERRYPTAGLASFVSDDARLEKIWAMGARTLELCALDAFVDCPGREQQSWIGDSYIHTLVAMVSNTDWRLVRRNLRIGAQSRKSDGLLSAISTGSATTFDFNIPEYSLHWVRALCRYVERSGDLETARELLPAAVDIVDAFERHRGDDGLLRTPPIVFVDWAQTERGSVTAAIDALYAAALLDHARLLDLVAGDRAGADAMLDRHARTAAALDLLWDHDRGVYVDALHDDTGPGRRVSQQTNALAIVGRCAPEHRWSPILEAVLDPARVKRTLSNGDLPEDQHWRYQRWEPSDFDAERDVVLAQPFMAHFLHQAVADAGMADRLVDLCLRWWPQLERGNTTFEEFWDAPPGTTSRCHAWSATPTFDLTTHVLGVRPVIESASDLGFRRARVAPSFGPLQRVAGRVPTPWGELAVDLTPTGGTVVVPDEMAEVTVELPGRTPMVLRTGSHVVGSG